MPLFNWMSTITKTPKTNYRKYSPACQYAHDTREIDLIFFALTTFLGMCPSFHLQSVFSYANERKWNGAIPNSIYRKKSLRELWRIVFVTVRVWSCESSTQNHVISVFRSSPELHWHMSLIFTKFSNLGNRITEYSFAEECISITGRIAVLCRLQSVFLLNAYAYACWADSTKVLPDSKRWEMTSYFVE